MTRAPGPYEEVCAACGGIKGKHSKCYDCPTGVTVLYRYEDQLNSDYPMVFLREFAVVRETRFTWFVELWDGHRSNSSVPLKRVGKDSRKSFAYPTIKLARASYVIRKRKQLGYLSRQHDHVAAIVARIEAGTAWDVFVAPDPFDGFSLAEGAKA